MSASRAPFLRLRCERHADPFADTERLSSEHVALDVPLPTTAAALEHILERMPRCVCGAELRMCSSMSLAPDGTVGTTH